MDQFIRIQRSEMANILFQLLFISYQLIAPRTPFRKTVPSNVKCRSLYAILHFSEFKPKIRIQRPRKH